MDPLAHTLVGASIAESDLKRQTPLAAATLIVAANAPDVDALVTFVSRDVMYGFRRGWTHGVLAWLVLPWIVVGAMLVVDRVRRRRRPEAPPAKLWRIWALAQLGVLTHPFLDWLNNYGIRLLMPLDGTWFYGDAIFIVDPWMWLLMAAAVVLARSSRPMSIGAWIVLGVATTGLVVTTELVPLAAKVAWAIAVGAIVLGRTRPELVARAHVVARVTLALLATYIATMLTGSAVARDRARSWFEGRGVDVRHVMAGPLPVNPFVRDVIVVAPDRYYFAKLDFLAEELLAPSHAAVPVNDGPIARAARGAPQVKGYSTWLRFPAYTIEERDGGYRVWIRDVRYSRMRNAIGSVAVDLSSDLQPIAVTH